MIVRTTGADALSNDLLLTLPLTRGQGSVNWRTTFSIAGETVQISSATVLPGNLSRTSPSPCGRGQRGGGNCHLLRVNRYSTPIPAWQTTQINSAVPNACGPRDASG